MVEHEFALRPVDDLRPHEETIDDRVDEITAGIRGEGELADPIVVDRETDVVLDGHHRLASLRRLDCDVAPVYLVDYRDDRIELAAWDDDREPPSKDDVVEAAKIGDLFPPRTTRHLNVKDFDEMPVDLQELR